MKPMILCAAAACLSAALPAAACTVDQHGIAGIRLGQKIAEVKRTFPKARLAQTQDGDGAELTEITLGKGVNVYAHLDEEKQAIEFLETFSPACQTRSGVRPRMRLNRMPSQLGRFKGITMSEIEMREYAEYARQPKWLLIRVEGGDFGTHQAEDFALPQKTRRFRADAAVLSLAVSAYR